MPFPIATFLASFAALVPTQGEPTLARFAEMTQPNYAARMEPPYKGTDASPRLVRMWASFPVRVAVLEDGDLYSDGAYRVICAGCRQWSAATKSVPGGGVSFLFEHSMSPFGVQILIRLARYRDLAYEAMATATGGIVTIDVEVTDRYDRWISEADLQRKIAHEMGHALGIGGHSPNSSDIMFAEPPACIVSLADVNTLRIAYGGFFTPLELPRPR